MEELITQLANLATAEYGAAFVQRVATDELKTAWATRWREIFRGKTKRRIMEAIDICFREYPRPFGTAEFQTVYKTCTKAATAPLERRIGKPTTSSDPRTGATVLGELRRAMAYGGPLRTNRNIELGIWTDEMEKSFQENWEVLKQPRGRTNPWS